VLLLNAATSLLRRWRERQGGHGGTTMHMQVST
jgi:hypothetical protein